MAAVNYEYIMVHVENNGHVSDLAVLQTTTFRNRLKDNTLISQVLQLLLVQQVHFIYVFVGDDFFSMWPNLLKSYSRSGLTNEKRIFSYRLSHARRVVETA